MYHLSECNFLSFINNVVSHSFKFQVKWDSELTAFIVLASEHSLFNWFQNFITWIYLSAFYLKPEGFMLHVMVVFRFVCFFSFGLFFLQAQLNNPGFLPDIDSANQSSPLPSHTPYETFHIGVSVQPRCAENIETSPSEQVRLFYFYYCFSWEEKKKKKKTCQPSSSFLARGTHLQGCSAKEGRNVVTFE